MHGYRHGYVPITPEPRTGGIKAGLKTGKHVTPYVSY
jgi:hypothetical protein